MKHILFLFVVVFSLRAAAQSKHFPVRAGDTAIVMTNDGSRYAGILQSDTGGVLAMDVLAHGMMKFPFDAVLSVMKAPTGTIPADFHPMEKPRLPFSAGTREISLIAGGGSVSSSTNGGSSNSETDIAILSSLVFYVADCFAIEPEVGITFSIPQSGSAMNSYSALLSLDYTFRSEGPTSPFIRAGYGVSNGIQLPIGRDIIAETDQNNPQTVNVLYFGVGIKSLLAKQVALRVELCYKGQSYTVPGTSGEFSYPSENYSLSTIGVQLGFTFLSGLQ